MNVLKMLQNVEGAATACVVATDALTPGSAQLLPKAFPSAEIVDGEELLRRARRIKTGDEIDAIRAAVRVAEGALAATEAALVPGISGRQLTGVFMEAMASAGITTPATQDVAWVASREQPWQRANRDAPVAEGDLVAIDASVVCDGYLGELGRTYPVGGAVAVHAELLAEWDGLWDRLIAACQPGATAQRPARRLRRRGSTTTPDADRAWARARVRPPARGARAAAHRARAASRTGHGFSP